MTTRASLRPLPTARPACAPTHATDPLAPQLCPDDWVLAAPFRAHLAQLVAHSPASLPQIAQAAGVPTAVVRRLCAAPAPRRIRRCDAERLLDLTVSQFQPSPTPPGGSVAAMPARRLAPTAHAA